MKKAIFWILYIILIIISGSAFLCVLLKDPTEARFQAIESRLDKLGAEPEVVRLPEFFKWFEEPECGQWSVKADETEKPITHEVKP